MIRISSHSAKWVLAVGVAAGLAIRLAILANTGGLTAKIVDEQQYSQIGRNLVAGHGFAWAENEPTSIRPPLYPALLAAVWHFSPDNLQAIRVMQILLGLTTAILVYTLGSRV